MKSLQGGIQSEFWSLELPIIHDRLGIKTSCSVFMSEVVLLITIQTKQFVKLKFILKEL